MTTEFTAKWPAIATLVGDVLIAHTGASADPAEVEQILSGLANNDWHMLNAMEATAAAF